MWICSAVLSLLSDNLIFTRALGTSTLMAATKNRSSLPVLALMMTVFSVLSCCLTGLLYRIPLLDGLRTEPFRLVQPMVYTAVISAVYFLVLLVLHLVLRGRLSAVKKYVHLAAFNCAVMGTLYLAFDARETAMPERFTPAGAALFGLQAGLGFLLAALMLSAVRERLYDAEVPAAFRGFPAVMVYLGLISMAVYAVYVK